MPQRLSLPYHRQKAEGYCLAACAQIAHAVVVIGYDAEQIWLLDPAALPEPMSVSIDEFMLAWGELDYRYAVLKPETSE